MKKTAAVTKAATLQNTKLLSTTFRMCDLQPAAMYELLGNGFSGHFKSVIWASVLSLFISSSGLLNIQQAEGRDAILFEYFIVPASTKRWRSHYHRHDAEQSGLLMGDE